MYRSPTENNLLSSYANPIYDQVSYYFMFKKCFDKNKIFT